MRSSKPSSPKHLTRSFNFRQFRQNLRGDADLLLRPKRRDDIYHWLLRIRWLPFFAIVVGTYLTLNFLFGLLYLLTNDGIANARPGSLVDTFFFSVQTLSTVGYGSMYPKNLAAQVLSGIEILFGVLLMALLTGILFARFSRPTARVMFSRVAVVTPYNGVPMLMFRTANRRESQILEARVQVTLLKTEISVEGQQMRRFYALNLVRSSSPVFALSWLVMHPIDENSPFYGLSRGELEEMDAELWITMTGIDETFSQTIYSRYAYSLDEIFWNARFVDIFVTREDGSRSLDLQYFHEITELGTDFQRE